MPKKIFRLALLLVASITFLAADTSTTRLDQVGHKLVCQCGCGQILMECNHVGCPVSGPMIEELRTQLTSTPTTPTPIESSVLNWFIAKYGPTVLASPIRGGFDNVAWIMPFAVLILGGAGVFLLLRLWKRRFARLQPAGVAIPTVESDDLRDRIRRDTNYGE